MGKQAVVKKMDGNVHVINHDEQTTIRELINEVAKKEGLDPTRVVLLSAGKNIPDNEYDKRIVELGGYQDRSTFFMAVRLKGGQ